MKLWTWSELKEKVEKDMDLQEESNITESELMGYANEAIDEAEAEIHNLYEDYFKTSDYVSLVSGTASYSLPSDIFAHKIRYIQYDNGSRQYKVERIKDKQKVDVESGDDYMYDIENSTAGESAKLVLYPTPQETSSTYMKRWYIRNANRLTGDLSVMDIPESAAFVMAHMKFRCARKEAHPLLPVFKSELEEERDRMLRILATMIPDNDERIEPDVSFYEDFDNDIYL